ncbi:hypothetical protein [Leptospira adleri]|uniref:hypothetical protein n=1 Tax=Leptospira adleri TaxID=2023186 RepID=UPI0013FD6041|nr:hypothetical protein [Leptospira adleri]
MRFRESKGASQIGAESAVPLLVHSGFVLEKNGAGLAQNIQKNEYSKVIIPSRVHP